MSRRGDPAATRTQQPAERIALEEDVRWPESKVEHARRQSGILSRGQDDRFRGGHQALSGRQPALNGRFAPGVDAQRRVVPAMSLSHRAGQHR